MANFFVQSQKLMNSIMTGSSSFKEENLINMGTISSRNKPRAPVLLKKEPLIENNVSITEVDKENLEPIELVLGDANKEIIKNSVKVS